jgi:hypothetical protein
LQNDSAKWLWSIASLALASKNLIETTGYLSRLRRVWLQLSRSVANITRGNMVLNQDFKEFLQSLNDNNVRYLVIGGYAMAFHGHPRYTKDLDIWIDLDQSNATKIVQALRDFGFASLNLEPTDFLEPDTTIQLGYPPSRIDLLIGLAGAAFDDCFLQRNVETVDGIKINIIDRMNLLRLKREAGRPQDLADIANLSE